MEEDRTRAVLLLALDLVAALLKAEVLVPQSDEEGKQSAVFEVV